jgi:hypothetical protein
MYHLDLAGCCHLQAMFEHLTTLALWGWSDSEEVMIIVHENDQNDPVDL